MDATVSHASAITFWQTGRLSDPRREGPKTRTNGEQLARAIKRSAAGIRALSKDAELLARVSVRDRIDLLATDARDRRSSKRVRGHVWSQRYPKGAVADQGGGLRVCTPEFAFLQMAAKLNDFELIQLGIEMCGTYACHFLPMGCASSSKVRPITSLQRLKSFIQRCKGLHGVKRCRRALRWIAKDSASPAETLLGMMLGLPMRLGGFGLGMPAFNHPVTVPGGNRLRCDLLWPDLHVGVEYDSREHHTGYGQAQVDSRRRALFQARGLTVLSVTADQISTSAKLAQVARALYRAAGQRAPRSTDEHFTRCMRLLSALHACRRLR